MADKYNIKYSIIVMCGFFKKYTFNHKTILSYLSFLFGIIFGFLGLLLPPIGLIHGSVLILIAQLFVLSGTFIGLDVKFDMSNKYFHAHQHDSITREDIAQIKKAVDEQFPPEKEEKDE